MNKVVMTIILFFSLANAYADNSICDQLVGTWKLTHISAELDKDLYANSSQSWSFSDDNKVVYRGFGEQELSYSCKGDVIALKSDVPNSLKVVRSMNNKMVWESVDFGGYIYVEK